jgi:hypothetical protein
MGGYPVNRGGSNMGNSPSNAGQNMGGYPMNRGGSNTGNSPSNGR